MQLSASLTGYTSSCRPQALGNFIFFILAASIGTFIGEEGISVHNALRVSQVREPHSKKPMMPPTG